MDDYTKEYPKPIESKYSMTDVNEPIHLLNGEFTIHLPQSQTKLNGDLFFRWYPTKGGFLRGQIDAENKISLNSMEDFSENSIQLKYLDDLIGVGFIQRLSNSTSDSFQKIEVVLTNKCFVGDESIQVREAQFLLPNSIIFSRLSYVSEKAGSFYSSRTTLDNEDFTIELDVFNDHRHKIQKLKNSSGYDLIQVGRIISKKANLTWNGLSFRKLQLNLSRFFSLINCRRISPQIIQGIYEENTKWVDFNSYSMQPYKNVIRWTPTEDRFQPTHLWQCILTFSTIEENGQFLDFILKWYTDANDTTNGYESSIVLAQIALELLYNWIVIEKNQIIRGNDADNISAANKIRILLTILNIDTETPLDLNNLKRLITSDSNLFDGVDAMVKIRNSLVHPKSKKIDEHLSIDSDTLHEVWLLSMMYVELGILWAIGYKGEFINRTSIGKKYLNDRIKRVPWVRE